MIRISLHSEGKKRIIARLIDNSGKILMTRTYTVTTGNNNIEINNLPSLLKGLYTLHIGGAGKSSSFRIAK